MGAALAVAVCLALCTSSVMAATRYLGDGAVQNNRGGFDIPAQGTCPAGPANSYTGIDTRPECVAMRLNIVQASCVAPNLSWTTSGVCNDLVNATQATCQAEPDRLWNPGTSVCSVVMSDDDRNDVTCMKHGGTWVTTGTCTGVWIMPAQTAYTPNLLTGASATSTSGPGPGDQCLRCHNSRTQYNSPRVRDTEDTMFMGHKNMARPWTTGQPGWGGPQFECTNALYTTEESCFDNGGDWVPQNLYPSDDTGNPFDWTAGTITVSGTPYTLAWIYGDWLGPMPRSIYRGAPQGATQVCSDPRGTAANCVSTYGGTLVYPAGQAYSCGRCHNTGWTSDATLTPTNADSRLTKEPERTFPGFTWTRTGDAGSDKVNVAGGVSNDANKTSSWDYWGITCGRCHSSAIDTTTGSGTPVRYSAPTGMSSHHSNLTATDNTSGVCTDVRFTAETQCTANGGTWLTVCSQASTSGVCTVAANTQTLCGGVAGATWTPIATAQAYCTDSFYADQANCEANGFVWITGYCTTADALAACTGGSGNAAKSWRANGSQASCLLANGANTFPLAKCDTEGVCNVGTCSVGTYVNRIDCETAGATWSGPTTLAACTTAGGQFRYATDIIRCQDAGGRWTGTNTQRGPLITRLCMDCHRQETAGLPNGATSTWDSVNNNVVVNYTTAFPSTNLKVGQYHSTVAFVSHPHGNQFLNSPHGKFAPTSSFDKIGTGTFNYALTGDYQSFFQTEYEEAAGVGNGCTGCHEVHTSVVTGEEPFRAECTDCHKGIYKKDLTKINHLWGKGTPMENAATDESGACEVCHMPGAVHMFRINTDPAYFTYPPALATATTSAACTAIPGGVWTASSSTCTANANTAPEGTYSNAVWVDLDAACGQCHGGGTTYAKTTGTIATASKSLTVTSSTGFTVGQRIRIASAGNFEYEDTGASRGDFDTYIAAIPDATTITLIGAAPIGATGVDVTQNPTVLVEGTRYAPYYSRADLAKVAEGMHDSSGLAYAVTFSIDANGLDVTTVPQVDGCTPTIQEPNKCVFTYNWTWNDTLNNTSVGNPGLHTYATGGTKTIKLVVKDGTGLEVGTSTRSTTLTAPNNPPVAAAACSYDPLRWTYSVDDNSTDGDLAQVIVNWGDGGVKSKVNPLGSVVNKTYSLPGNYTVTLTAYDSLLQSSTYTCSPALTPADFPLYGISGTVRGVGGTGTLANAVVILKKSGVTVASTTSAANGTFAFTNKKPGTYTITVVKPGYVFNVPAINNIVIGGNASGLFADATSQSSAQQRSATSAARNGGR